MMGLRSVESFTFLSSALVKIGFDVWDKLNSVVDARDVGYEKGLRYRLTDVTHVHDFGNGHIHNLGVYHHRPFLRRFYDRITGTIDACDMLLIEGGEREHDQFDDFSRIAGSTRCERTSAC
jgi:hypothetical protein